MIRTRRSRAVMVLDGAAVCRLSGPLQDRNFLVIRVDAIAPDDIAGVLTGRVLVTLDACRYLEDTLAYEFAVIEVPATGEPQEIAARISQEFSRNSLADAEPFFLQLGGKSSKLSKIVECAGSGGEDS